MKAIIPTGGRGTRMRPLTFSTNKHFIPLMNKPIIFYPIEAVADAGIKDVAITYNLDGLDEAKEILGDGSRWGLKFTYILQEKPKGLANIFQVCEDFLDGDPFVLHLGDNIFVDGIKKQLDFFLKEKPNGLVTMVKHKDNRRLGVPFFDEKGKFIRYVEKPENPPNDFGIVGLYFFDKEVFNCFKGPGAIKPSDRGELEISAPYNFLIDKGFKVDALEYEGVWMDPGKFDDWILANKYLLEHKLEDLRESEVDKETEIMGKVSIGNSCQIKKSKIKGPAILGDNVVIEDSEVGPDTSISDGCQIRNSKVENSVLMRGVKIENVIDHPITGSLIGTDTEVTGANGHSPKTSLFVGEKCKITL